jgi:hypothetical protein
VFGHDHDWRAPAIWLDRIRLAWHYDRRSHTLSTCLRWSIMNRFERRKAEAVKRKIGALTPGARELAIQTGMELHDALAETRKQGIRSLVEKEWAARYSELYKKVSDEQAERVAEVDRKAREYHSDVVRWRRAYLTTLPCGV